jgi:hypothetical protein
MKKSITLMELLVALTVTTVIILYFFAIEKIGRQDLFTTDHRAKVQNEVSYVLQHMSKNLPKTIGSRAVSGQDPVSTSAISGDAALRFFVDLDLTADCSTANSAGDGQWNTECDHWRAYRYRSSSASPAADRYQLWYYAYCPGADCGTETYEIISEHTTAFNCSITNNYVDVEVTGCWDPDGSPYACGTTSNPSVTMHAYINMPAVSTN